MMTYYKDNCTSICYTQVAVTMTFIYTPHIYNIPYLPDLVLGNFSTITAFLNTAKAPILLLTASIACCITASELIVGCSGVGSLSTSRPRGT